MVDAAVVGRTLVAAAILYTIGRGELGKVLTTNLQRTCTERVALLARERELGIILGMDDQAVERGEIAIEIQTAEVLRIEVHVASRSEEKRHLQVTLVNHKGAALHLAHLLVFSIHLQASLRPLLDGELGIILEAYLTDTVGNGLCVLCAGAQGQRCGGHKGQKNGVFHNDMLLFLNSTLYILHSTFIYLIRYRLIPYRPSCGHLGVYAHASRRCSPAARRRWACGVPDGDPGRCPADAL